MSDRKVAAVPVKECGERLVDVRRVSPLLAYERKGQDCAKGWRAPSGQRYGKTRVPASAAMVTWVVNDGTSTTMRYVASLARSPAVIGLRSDRGSRRRGPAVPRAAMLPDRAWAALPGGSLRPPRKRLESRGPDCSDGWMDDDAEVVERGRYEGVATPWDGAAWRRAALDWTGEALAARGLRQRGRRTVRLRPWSVLVRVPVEGGGDCWFKAHPPGSAFEGALTEALARWVPDSVLRPLAVDTTRGWTLLPDGGPLVLDVLDRLDASDGQRLWEEVVRRYAETQRTLTAHVGELASLGVPVVPTAALPEFFDDVLASARTAAEERARLEALRPRVAEWAGELAALGVADSLDHADLHEKQVFHPAAGRFTYFDWGDALVSHPFASFLVAARAARERYGPAALPRLRDAYLEPWTGGGASAAELRRALALGARLGVLGRAASFGRLFPGNDDGELPRAQGRWLSELLREPVA